MRTISLKNAVLAMAGVLAASVSAVPSLTPIISISTSDGAVTIESMPQVVPGTGSVSLPPGLSEAPGPVVTGGTGTGSVPSSGSVSFSSVTSSSTNSTRTTSGTGTSTAPTSTSSTGAGLSAYASPNVLVAGLFMLSAAGVHLL